MIIGKLDEDKNLDNFCILGHSTKSRSLTLCGCSVHRSKKTPTVSLSRQNVPTDNKYPEITKVVQPVIELLAYSELAYKCKKPKVLFFANRKLVRPFIYFRDADVLLTIQTPIPFLSSENSINIEGIVLMSLLMEGRTSPAQFLLNAETLFSMANIPQSNFANSIHDGFRSATLSISRMKDVKGADFYHHKKIDASEGNQLLDEVFEKIRKEKASPPSGIWVARRSPLTCSLLRSSRSRNLLC